MYIAVLILLVFVAALCAIYFLSPRTLYNFLQRSLRRRGGLVQKSVKVGDYMWPYLEGGVADGEVLLMVHGFGGDKDNWALYSPDITANYRLISPDLPGFGENDRSLNRDYDIATQVERLIAFMDVLQIEKFHIGGNSMGGFIALKCALEHADRLLSLTLINNAGVIGSDKSPLQIEAEQGGNPLAIQSAEDVKRMMAFVAHKPTFLPGQFRRLFFEDANAHKELLDKIFWSIADDGMNNPVNDKLGGMTTPTLIIWGQHDQLIDVSCVAVLEAGITGSEAFVFEDAGHIPMIEKPKATAARQLAFLAKVSK